MRHEVQPQDRYDVILSAMSLLDEANLSTAWHTSLNAILLISYPVKLHNETGYKIEALWEIHICSGAGYPLRCKVVHLTGTCTWKHLSIAYVQFGVGSFSKILQIGLWNLTTCLMIFTTCRGVWLMRRLTIISTGELQLALDYVKSR